MNTIQHKLGRNFKEKNCCVNLSLHNTYYSHAIWYNKAKVNSYFYHIHRGPYVLPSSYLERKNRHKRPKTSSAGPERLLVNSNSVLGFDVNSKAFNPHNSNNSTTCESVPSLTASISHHSTIVMYLWKILLSNNSILTIFKTNKSNTKKSHIFESSICCLHEIKANVRAPLTTHIYINLPLTFPYCFLLIVEIKPKTGFYRLPNHSHFFLWSIHIFKANFGQAYHTMHVISLSHRLYTFPFSFQWLFCLHLKFALISFNVIFQHCHVWAMALSRYFQNF